MNKKYKNYDIVIEYAKSVVEGRKISCRETIQMCERFFRDLENPKWDFNPIVVGLLLDNGQEIILKVLKEKDIVWR